MVLGAALGVLLFAFVFVAAQGDPDGSCDSIRTCGKCVDRVECGWCTATGTCQLGNVEGNQNLTCAGGGWHWDDCPCESETVCGDCVQRGICGWRGDLYKCIPMFHHFNSSLSGALILEPRQCPSCSMQRNCGNCADSGCSWCPDVDQCVSTDAIANHAYQCHGDIYTNSSHPDSCDSTPDSPPPPPPSPPSASPPSGARDYLPVVAVFAMVLLALGMVPLIMCCRCVTRLRTVNDLNWLLDLEDILHLPPGMRGEFALAPIVVCRLFLAQEHTRNMVPPTRLMLPFESSRRLVPLVVVQGPELSLSVITSSRTRGGSTEVADSNSMGGLTPTHTVDLTDEALWSGINLALAVALEDEHGGSGVPHFDAVYEADFEYDPALFGEDVVMESNRAENMGSEGEEVLPTALPPRPATPRHPPGEVLPRRGTYASVSPHPSARRWERASVPVHLEELFGAQLVDVEGEEAPSDDDTDGRSTAIVENALPTTDLQREEQLLRSRSEPRLEGTAEFAILPIPPVRADSAPRLT